MSASQPSLDLVPLLFDGQDVSYVLINGDPWWPAGGPCEVLGYELKHVDAVLKRHTDADERQKLFLPGSGGGIREQWCINEFGLYGLIMGSQKPDAKRFQRWIKHEVIPSIVRTSGYQAKPDNIDLSHVLPNINPDVQRFRNKQMRGIIWNSHENKKKAIDEIILFQTAAFHRFHPVFQWPRDYVKAMYEAGEITNKGLSYPEASRRMGKFSETASLATMYQGKGY